MTMGIPYFDGRRIPRQTVRMLPRMPLHYKVCLLEPERLMLSLMCITSP